MTIAIIAVLAAGCGGDDGGGEDASLVTVGDLGLDLPISVPPAIPAPSDGEYVGQPPAEPWSAVQIGSAFDPEALRQAVRSFADTEPSARFDETIQQLVFEADIEGLPHSVYVWVRTNADIDLSTILEIGTVPLE